jgi:regulatory protein
VPPTTTEPARPRGTARAAALRALAFRRLTEAQLWKKLLARGHPDDEVAAAVAACKADGYLDDRLFAQLFVDGKRKAVGDARLVAELVKRGIERDAARTAVATATCNETERLAAAADKLFRQRPGLGYPNAARALERLGFAAPSIYRHLRKCAASDFANCDLDFEESPPGRA